jgi:hypothetical protein
LRQNQLDENLISMTMAEIEERLPAGFHDAELLNLSVDYVRSEAKLDFSLWTPSEEEREKYSAASLYLEGLQYLIIEPPSTEGEHYQSCVDGYVSAKSRFPIEGLPAAQEGKFAHSLFVVGWNSSIHIGAASARLEPATLLEPESSADAL